MSAIKKIYVLPTVEVLGSIAEKTQTGTAPSADTQGGQNNTAFPAGS